MKRFVSLLCDNPTMEVKPRILKFYVALNGVSPFKARMRSLKDKRSRARTLQRIDRLRLGNFGDCRSVGEGVHRRKCQLKIMMIFCSKS